MNIIDVKHLKKTYGGAVPNPVLKDINLSIKEGEFVALMGRSGSGKSTLLHQLGLLDAPTDGEIIIDGVNILTLSDTEKVAFRLDKLGYVFQSYALLPELTALESVSLPLRIAGASKKEYTQKATEMLEKVGLADKIDRLPKEMSGGEQQRVSIARALVNNPKIVFADEPTANLDTASSIAVIKLFKQLNKELQQTIVMVTHEDDDQKEVNRVIWLKDGFVSDE